MRSVEDFRFSATLYAFSLRLMLISSYSTVTLLARLRR